MITLNEIGKSSLVKSAKVVHGLHEAQVKEGIGRT